MKTRTLLLFLVMFGFAIHSRGEFSLSMGNSEQSGSTNIFPNLTVTAGSPLDKGYVIRFMFTRSVTTSETITLPALPGGWAEDISSTQYVRMINIPGGASATALQAFLRQVKVTYDPAKEGNAVMVLISSNSTDAGRNVYFSSHTGHWYEYVGGMKLPPDATHPYGYPYEWWEAYNRALDRRFLGLNGYLAVITSEEENDFIFSVSSGKMGWIGGARGDIRTVLAADGKHLTGRPSFGVTCTDQSQYLDYWYWACGPEYDGNPVNSVFYNKKTKDSPAALVTVKYDYNNWWSAEPNNYTRATSCEEHSAQGENFLHLGWDGKNGWNDYGVFGYNANGPTNPSIITGMIVEYEGTMSGVTAEATVGFYPSKNASLNGTAGNGTASSPIEVLFGEKVSYTILAKNTSGSSKAVTVIDTVRSGMKYVAGSASPLATLTQDSILSWDIEVAEESSKTITYQATPKALNATMSPNVAWVTSSGTVIKGTGTTYHQPKIFTVNFAAGSNGNVTNNTPQKVDFTQSAVAGVGAVPNKGYKFTGWSYPSYSNYRTGAAVPSGTGITDYTTVSIYNDLTFTANFSLIDYTITYELAGGTHTGTPATYDYNQSVSIAPPTRNGYTFTGWTIENDSATSPSVSQPATPTTTPVTFGPSTVYGNLKLTAGWIENDYTITYSLPIGATHTQTPNSYKYTDSKTVADPTMPGYIFKGWTISNDEPSSPAITPTKGVSFGPSTVFGNLTFTAATPPAGGGDNVNWEQIKYKITYDLDGGSHGTNHPDKYTVTDNVSIDIPERSGYTFAGWTITCDSASATVPTSGDPTAFGPGDNVYGDLAFKANWSTDAYMITYKPGATGASLNNVNNPTTYDVEDLPITLDDANALYPGHTFVNWKIESDVAGVTIPDGMSVPAGTTGNLTCTAQWSLNPYTITYTIPSGVTNPATNPTGYDVTQDVSVADPSMPGYTFIGWTITNDSASSPAIAPLIGVSWTPNTVFGNLVFKVTLPPAGGGDNENWSENIYNITYDYKGGTAPSTANPTTYTVNTPTITLNDPTRSGYTFSGWNIVSDSASVTIPAGKQIPQGSYGNLTCTAVWGAVPYNITYDYNDDPSDPSTHPANPTSYDIDILPVSISLQPVRLHWDFAGWTGTTLSVPALTETVTATSIGVPGDLAYTANWTKKKYNVLYDLNTADVGTAPTDAGSPYEWDANVTILNILAGTSKTNATFIGWMPNTAPALITAANVDTDTVGMKQAGSRFLMPTHDITFYAVWAEDKYGPDGGPDGVPDYLQTMIIYNDNTNFPMPATVLPDTVMSVKNSIAVIKGNEYGLQLNDTVVFLGWSEANTGWKIVEHGTDKPSDLKKGGSTVHVGTTTIKYYVVWAYDHNKDGVPDCEEPSGDVVPEVVWPETPEEPGHSPWEPEYDDPGKGSVYSGCIMTLDINVDKDPYNDRKIKLRYEGPLDAKYYLDEEGNQLDTVYTLAAGDSIMHINFSVDTAWSSSYEGQTVSIVAEVVGGGNFTNTFVLYKHPTLKSMYITPYYNALGYVDFGIVGGSPNLMRSINGGTWRNAYLPLTNQEKISVTNGAHVLLREPYGCWETEVVFMYVDPTIQRYVDIPDVDGITTTPNAGKHYIEGHKDFSFTTEYADGVPLKVMALGYYSGLKIELIGQNLYNGQYKYTLRQVVEPWTVSFGPDAADEITGNEVSPGISVWTFNNVLYIRSDVNTKAHVYNISGSLCKSLNITAGSNREYMQRGIYIVVIGEKRYKVIIK